MAPEQWLGAGQDVRTDIYAFGITLYEMCYLRRPFAGPDFVQQHLHVDLKIPNGMFASIIARCLAKDPAMRYDTPSKLLEDVARICRNNNIPLLAESKAFKNRPLELHTFSQSLRTLGKIDEALAAAEELIRFEPEYSANWNLFGMLLLDKGEDSKAIDAFHHSLSLDETRSSYWNNLGVALKRQKKWNQAMLTFERALNCDPFNISAMFNSADALHHLGVITHPRGLVARRLRRG